jgi:eukaryotic-like serine/threonine-protein kinase
MPSSHSWSDVKQALADALELPAHERTGFLERTCRDPALRLAVERLLRSAERAAASKTLLDVPMAEFAAPLIVEVDEQEHAGSAALRVALAGRYTLERQLGRGGMGVVYLARDERHGRPVALKVVHSAVALGNGPSLGTHRFQREIEFAARLTHPHILPLHDSGTAAGLLYYVMPHVDGESLRDRLARAGRQPIDVTLRLLRDVTRALAYAHRRGVVHRDIKPGNILLNQDGDALVSDFGVAKAFAAAASSASMTPDPEMSITGMVLGTAAYIAPEQAAGDPTTDHRADLYALGVVAYEMLTGSTPFGGRDAHETLAAHLSEEPEPVASRRPDAPSALASLVMQLLAKSPADRPNDAAEVLESLDAAINHPEASSATPRARTRGSPVRRLARAGGGLLLFFVVFLAFPGRRELAPVERSIAVLPFVNTNGGAEDEPFSDGLTDELISALSKVPGLKVAGRTSTFALKGRGLGVRAIADTLGVTTVIEGSVRRDGEQLKVTTQIVDARDGRVLWSETYEREFRDVFAVQEGIARDIVTALSIRLTRSGIPGRLVEHGTEDLEAYDLYLKGRFLYNTRQRDALLRARTYFEQAILRDPSYARPHAGLANVYNNLAVFGYERPHDAFPKARAAAERALALDSSLVEAHAALAQQLFVYDWSWEAAGTAFERAIALDPGYQGVRNLYSMYLHVTGRHAEALEQLRVARTLDPLVPTGPLAGRIYVNTRQPDAAIRELHEALEFNPHLDLAHELLGHAYLQKGMHTQAIASLQRAAELSGPRDSAQLAYMYGAIGQRAEARLIMQRLLDTRAERYLPPFHIAMAYAGLGEADEAFRWLEEAFEQRDSFMDGLAVTMGFDAIRSDPRFAGLLRRMGLDSHQSVGATPWPAPPR